MKDLKELLKEGKALVEEMEDLEEQYAKAETDEEREKVEEKLEAKEEELDAKEKAIERAKKLKAKNEKFTSIEDEAASDADGKTAAPDGGDGDSEPEAGKTSAEAKDHEKEQRAKERIFRDYLQGKELSGQAHEELAPQSPNWDEASDGKAIPQHLLPAMFGKRWGKAMSRGKTMLSSDTDDEANLVDEDYRAELLELEPEPGHLLGRVTIVPTDTGTIKIPRLQQTDSDEYGGVSFSWINEGGEKSNTEPSFEQVEISTHECAGYTEMSKTMIGRSSVPIIALLRRLYRSAANAEIDSQILGGSGTGQPLGIINTDGIRYVGRESAGEVGKADFLNLKHKILPHHRDQTSWVIHDDVEQDLELTELTANRKNRLFFTDTNEILNYPYEVTTRQPSKGSDGDVIYGDPSWYFMAQEQEVVIETSRHYKFRNNLQAFVLYFLIGGRLVEPRAMATLVGASS